MITYQCLGSKSSAPCFYLCYFGPFENHLGCTHQTCEQRKKLKIVIEAHLITSWGFGNLSVPIPCVLSNFRCKLQQYKNRACASGLPGGVEFIVQ